MQCFTIHKKKHIIWFFTAPCGRLDEENETQSDWFAKQTAKTDILGTVTQNLMFFLLQHTVSAASTS